MIQVLHADGSTSIEPRATNATLQGDYLVCRDKLGLLVATFDRSTVVAFGDAALKLNAKAETPRQESSAK